MAKIIELNEHEEGVLERVVDTHKKYIASAAQKNNGIGQVAFAEKYGFDQSFYSNCLKQREYLTPTIVMAVAKESGKAILWLDPKYNDPERWKRPRNNKRQSNANEGHFLYILEQPDRDIDRPIAKIGITNNLSKRLKEINRGAGVSDTWWLYRYINLGMGHAFLVEKAVKNVLSERYKRLNNLEEIFLCTPNQILGAAMRAISKNKDCTNATWAIDPDPEKISNRLQEEFDELVEERRVFLESEGCTQDEIDSELNIPIGDTSWWN
jgi:hypothetical protein